QPERQDGRGNASRRADRVRRAVPPRGLARAERRRLPVGSLLHADAEAHPALGAPPRERAMIYPLLDRLAERYSEKEHKLEAMRAREEYFERAGKVLDDDAELFEGRMASFLEWYVLERPLAGIGLTPVACAIEEGPGRAGEQGEAAAALSSSHHSVFELFETSGEMLDIEDLIGGAR